MEFKRGDIVYTITGHKARYIQEVDGKHYVYILDDDMNGGMCGGAEVIVNVVYKEWPVSKLSEEILELKEEKDNLLKEIGGIQKLIKKKKNEFDSLLNDLEETWSGLRNLKAVLEGKVMFLVFPNSDYVPVIKSWDEVAYTSSDYGTPALKAMSIFVNGEKGPEVFMAHFSDGSGYWKKVIFCVDEEEAKQVSIDQSIDYLRRHKAGEFDKRYDRVNIALNNVKNIKSLGGEIPDDLKEYVDGIFKEKREKDIRYYITQYNIKKKDLEKIEEKLKEWDVVV